MQAGCSGVTTGASIVHYLHSNLDDDTGCTCSRFSDNTNLEGVENKPNSGASVERTLRNLKIGSAETSWSLTRSAKLCTWGWIVSGTSAGCLSSRPAEKHVVVTVDTKLNMSQQSVFIVNKVNHRHQEGSMDRRWIEIIIPPYSVLVSLCLG